MRAKDITKRSLMLVLVAWITFVSVFHAYETTTECAEWIAGTIATIGAGPMLTALLVGGVVVAGGVAVYKIATTDPDDYRSFASGIKQGFQEFVADQEKQIALEQNSSLTDQEAADIGVANARETVNGFFDNAINTTKTTAKNITFNAQRYWQLYSKIIGEVADNGIGNDEIITENSVVRVPLVGTSETLPMTNIGRNCRDINGAYYVVRGDFFGNGINSYDNNLIFALYNYDSGFASSWYFNYSTNNFGNIDSKLVSFDSLRTNTNIPVISGRFGSSSNEQWQNYVINNWRTVFKVGGSISETPTWKRTINDTLNSTKFGDAIQTGRRQLVNEGDHIISVFKEDSVPVNKVGLRENEGVMTGEIGWQIPQTWDDYFGGSIPFPDIVGGTGSIGVPYPDVIPGVLPKDVTVDFPADTDVQDTSDYPRNPADEGEGEGEKPQEIPEKPAQDVFETQGGNYYPTAMDLTNIFPFCIPFDLIYLVEKFDIHGANAPVITIPIVYPQVMANATGSDRYDVVIDFADFLVLRNIVRIFLLLGFIIGLLKMTRELIRG